MSSVLVSIIIIASILSMIILTWIDGKKPKCDVERNWEAVWKERLRIDN